MFTGAEEESFYAVPITEVSEPFSMQIMMAVPIDQDLFPDSKPSASNNDLQQVRIPYDTQAESSGMTKLRLYL